ncbi:hypothetical protein WH96_04080 [Kiloniella spongiae]|uniref:Uncharacterized protein n=1 Tax=Kiloniella spongiae TaxID=1489064 RepID=A0A0H2MG84_9PROT|nr:hypothetical protein WH96_04080 [Kiloniella spongiae]
MICLDSVKIKNLHKYNSKFTVVLASLQVQYITKAKPEHSFGSPFLKIILWLNKSGQQIWPKTGRKFYV